MLPKHHGFMVLHMMDYYAHSFICSFTPTALFALEAREALCGPKTAHTQRSNEVLDKDEKGQEAMGALMFLPDEQSIGAIY